MAALRAFARNRESADSRSRNRPRKRSKDSRAPMAKTKTLDEFAYQYALHEGAVYRAFALLFL